MFSLFERLLPPTARSPEGDPPGTAARFYWHYVRQSRGLVLALFATGLATAMLDATIPVFIGRIVALLAHTTPARILADGGALLATMAGVLLVARPAALALMFLVTNQAINPGFSNLIRWQTHFHVVRQSWTFFQNDFAGRIANRVMQTGPSLRESVVQVTNAVWYIVVYGGSAIVLLSRADWRLAVPLLLWFGCYGALLRLFVPRMRERSRRVSEARSNLTGRVVDSYTNILTVKLFARPREEDALVRSSVEAHTAAFRRQTRMITGLSFALAAMNACLLAATTAIAILLWRQGKIGVGAVGTALPLAWQIANISGWVAQNVTSIFENVGTVLDGMRSIAVPLGMRDRPGAVPLRIGAGAIRFERLSFDYGRERGRLGLLHELDLEVRAGERIGLVGHSGAGKSTLVNLLLRFHDPSSGRILIDGQDIAGVTQESLRAEIAMVTQDTSLLHRSIRDNISYGRPDASEREIEDAAARAHADGFVAELEDWEGRRGMEAHVGERGVKLSGGQRQRIAIARVILKDAPILILDEATSALDSEVEAAIQEQLGALMAGRTVIAIAHRLSTIARMDRLVVLERGRIVEQGSHAALLASGGAYARLWARQSGGFLAEEAARLDTVTAPQ